MLSVSDWIRLIEASGVRTPDVGCTSIKEARVVSCLRLTSLLLKPRSYRLPAGAGAERCVIPSAAVKKDLIVYKEIGNN